MIFDTHAHYDDEAFQDDREEVLSSLRGFQVEKAVNVASDLSSSRTTVELIKRYPFMYGAVGVHPDHAGEITKESLGELSVLADEEKIVAIGEIGLDYYWNKENKEVQKQAFQKQLTLAVNKQLPIIVHSREAAEDTFQILQRKYEESGKQLTGVIHCFSSGKELAEEYTKRGFYIGIGGVLTFKNARKLREVAQNIPLDRLVLETDCPYLAPVPHRGERNFSGYLPLVCEELSRLLGLTVQDVIRITTENANRLYRLPAE